MHHVSISYVDGSGGVPLISGMDQHASYGITPPDHRLPDATQLGPVHLQIANLPRSIAYYTDVIGLRVLEQHTDRARLGPHEDDRTLIVLHEFPGARPVPRRGRLGLFHVAILLPDRASLGRFLTHLTERNEHPGMSDHFVSEALYLNDPDGLGLEIYADRPREQWRARDRQLAMGTEPLDVRAVLAAANGMPWTGAPAGTTIGHVHLHVGDLARASDFYHDMLGMDKTVWEYPGALFLGAGGYHHHLGTNTWASGAESAHHDEARLLEWTVEVPSAKDVHAVAESAAKRNVAVVTDGDAIVLQDPWRNKLRVLNCG